MSELAQTVIDVSPQDVSSLPPAEVLFAKMPKPNQQAVFNFLKTTGVDLETALLYFAQRGIAPGMYFVEQLPGEPEMHAFGDYCTKENLSPEAAILSIITRALEQPQILDQASRSPFVAQAQQQLGDQSGGLGEFQMRTSRTCESCGNNYKPRNRGQKYCENPKCWANGAGLITDAERNGVPETSTPAMDSRMAKLEGMFEQLMQRLPNLSRAA